MTNITQESVDATKVGLALGRTKPKSVGLLGRLSVGQKLALSGVTLALPATLLLGNTLLNEQRELSQIRHQLTGQSYLQPLSEIQNTLRTAGVPALAYLSGNTGGLDTYKQAAAKAFASIDSAIAVAQKSGNADLERQLKKIRADYNALYKDTLDKAIPSPVYSTRSTGIIGGELTPLFAKVAQQYNLNLVQDELSYNLVQMTTKTLASRLPAIGYSFGVGINTAAAAEKQHGKLSEVQKVSLDNAIRNGESAQKEIQDLVDSVNASGTRVSEDLKNKFNQLAQATAQDYQIMRTELLDSSRAKLSSAQVRQYSAEYLPLQYEAYTAANNEIGAVLKRRAAATNSQFLTLLLLSALIIALVAALLYTIARTITLPLHHLTDASQRLSQGDLNVQVPVTTTDEIGSLSSSFNAAAAQLKANAEHDAMERAEARRLQENVGEFLDVTMDIADGDLTRRGKVTEDVLGNVVDSINLMTEELAGTLKNVQAASQSVSSGSQAMLNTTAQIEQGSMTTTEQAQRLAQQASEVNAQIQEMARLAQNSAETARRALAAAQQGENAVGTTLQGMQAIRDSSLSVAQRVDSLAQRSEEIQGIVDSISNISSQTNLLALHASLEAAGAGEAGGRFAVVADEIRQLADESSAATARVANLLATVQSDIQEVNASMQQSFAQVQAGYQQAEQAGNSLRQLGTLSQDSAQLADQISGATQAQVQNVGAMGQRVQEIAEIAAQAQQSVQQGRSAAEQLQQLAQQLSSSLSRFRLPS